MIFRIINKPSNKFLFGPIIYIIILGFMLSLNSCVTSEKNTFLSDDFENEVEDPNGLNYTEFVIKKDSSIRLNEHDRAVFLKSRDDLTNVFEISKFDTVINKTAGQKQTYKLVRNLIYLKLDDVQKIKTEKPVLNILTTSLLVLGISAAVTVLFFAVGIAIDSRGFFYCF